MKRKRKPLSWLIPPAVAILALVFIIILSKRPAKTGAKSGSADVRPSSSAPGKTDARSVPAAPPPRAAIIIDDIGYSLEAIENVYAVGRPLTVSILPYANLTEESARLAAACNLEIMLHLPLESNAGKNGTKDVEGTISAGKTDREVRTGVEKCLARVPNARGVNNHAGSATTEEAKLMRPILEVLKERGLYFIDSRTTSASVAREEAAKMGVRAAARQVFIDAEPGEKAITEKLRELFRLAKKNGRAVGICHPKRESLAALARHAGLADAYGVTLVFASAIVE
ncbi:MAG: divergent polysaccharide deacetylase family protein [Candidatus Aminicenantes bacterium]|nr:divergent polysaccharide deacetylase family protein [Candidatus Aminicenantes bacterium]